MKKVLHDGRVTLYHGDSRDILKEIPDNSIDSCVCDPPYALVSIQKRFGKPGSAPAKGNDAYMRASAGFMGANWDVGETAFAETFWAEVLRVLKPGGHVVAFSGTRTYHRMAVAIEDAGFEIRDRIRFEQSFDTKYGPLLDSMNDEQRGALLELMNDYCDGGSELAWEYGSGFPKSHNQHGDWEGWGTSLKPAYEPICLARKPLCGTVAANLAEWGVGALNVDGCRVSTSDTYSYPNGPGGCKGGEFHYQGRAGTPAESNPLGRWPANIVHDGSDEVLAAFPDAPGQQRSVGPEHGEKASQGIYGDYGAREHFAPSVETDKNAARFFYCAKASRKDRDEGLAAFETQMVDVLAGHRSRRMEEVKRPDGAPPAVGKNIHPTVKPVSLCQWLCRLVTPPGGVILDPFMGSGSTGKAAILEGFRFVGIEREDEYMPIAEARIAWAVGSVSTPDEAKKPETKSPANDNVVSDLFSYSQAAIGKAAV